MSGSLGQKGGAGLLALAAAGLSASGGVGPGEREGKAVGKSGPRERADRAGVRESWAARAGLLAVGVWAGFSFLPSSFSNKLKPHSNLIEFKPNLNSNPMHSTK